MVSSIEATIPSACLRVQSRFNAAMVSEITEPKPEQQVSEMEELVPKLESSATKSKEEVPSGEAKEANVRSFPCKPPSHTDPHPQPKVVRFRPKVTDETATQQAASKQINDEFNLAAEAAEAPAKVKLVREIAQPKKKRRYTKRSSLPTFPPYGPTDPGRQGAAFRTELLEEEEEMEDEEMVDDGVAMEDVKQVPAAYPKHPDRTYFPDGSRCS